MIKSAPDQAVRVKADGLDFPRVVFCRPGRGIAGYVGGSRRDSRTVRWLLSLNCTLWNPEQVFYGIQDPTLKSALFWFPRCSARGASELSAVLLVRQTPGISEAGTANVSTTLCAMPRRIVGMKLPWRRRQDPREEEIYTPQLAVSISLQK